MMLHIPAVLTRDQVATMRAQLDQSGWVDGRATVGAQAPRSSTTGSCPKPPRLRGLGLVVLAALAANPMFFAAALPLRIVPPLFNRYGVGEEYGAHVDGAVRQVPGSALPLRTDVSATLFLSGPDEYDGGELLVMDTYGAHEVKLAAGDLVVYPSSSVHKVEPVTRGERICSFFWVQSMMRDDARRSMLLDLDQNIQRQRARLGDCEELVGLTSHYHNLLRQWAEPDRLGTGLMRLAAGSRGGALHGL